ncbi:MAG: hypothetical protein KC613_13255, partial [Myxococcales bacterium]|nr:hypothetical protein [Myxococcales bacterium]
MTRGAWALAVTLGAAAWAAAPAAAQGPEACDDTVAVDAHRYYRQLSLDLRGHVPSVAELERLEGVSEAEVDGLLEGEGFDTFVRRHHLDLLWSALEPGNFLHEAYTLLLPAAFVEGGTDYTDRLFTLFVGLYQRGGLVPCLDAPAEWDAEGNLVFEAQPDGTRREGYVLVEPYWAPGTEVKVCAAEAGLELQANNGASCDDYTGMVTGTCGCGPNLMRCASYDVALELADAFREQVLQMVQAPIAEGRPYTDMLTSDAELLNGPLVHYYRHLAPMAVDPIVLRGPVAPADLPDIPYTDKAWRPAPREHAEHAGVLTSVAYLLRFPTARARANRYYHAFLCQPFVAPPDGLPSPNDPCSSEPDLRERCGCSSCHTQLEPAAAYWGRFAEAGTLYLDPEQFPTYLPRCAQCAQDPNVACDGFCQRFYVSEIGHPKQAPFAGVLKSYEFRPPAEIANLEAGPGALVQRSVDDGRLARCVSEKLFERLYKRAPTARELAFDV